MQPSSHVPAGHLHAAGLDSLTQCPHNALQQLQQHVGVHNPQLARAGPKEKHRQHPYGPTARATGAAGPIRRRVSRACDQCNQLRTKCDGQHPCAHCIEFGLGCEYIRERKKRGKASQKDLAQQAAAQAATVAAAQNGQKWPIQGTDNGSTSEQRDSKPMITSEQSSANNDPSVVKACDTIARAHEGGVVTLNDEYQRNFSRVMGSALAHVRGRVPEDPGEQHQRRRELLALYRWTGDGTGLAL